MKILSHISNYLNGLDWAYILTFIIIAYGLNNFRGTNFFYEILNIRMATRYRVLIIGFVYGIMVYFIRGYDIIMVECLLQSFVFSLVFYKLLLEKLLNSIFQINL